MGTQSTVELAIGSEFAGYRIEEVAARGGMGVVYRAVQVHLTRTVALKLVTPALARDPAFRERFRREWMIAASIDHPNVIPVYEAGEEDGVLFIAMRWVAGTNLRQLIDQGPLEPSRAALLISQVAYALDAAHEQELIHRDVKPANILVTGQDHVYLSDFGLTKHASSISGLTKTGQWVGTVEYTAPEQIEGSTVSARTDVYSLACVLFEALTGRSPFARENELATLWAHVYTEPPSVLELSPGLSPRFDALLKRAMAKDPAERQASAGELGRQALAAAAESNSSTAVAGAASAEDRPTPQPRRDRRASTLSRRTLLGLAGLLVVIAAAVAGVLALTGSDKSSEKASNAPSGEAQSPAAAAGSNLRAGAWRPLPQLPTPRQNGAATVLDGTIWVVGGLAPGSKGSRKVEGYDPVINEWKSGPDLPAPLHHEMVVTYKGELVVMGGWIPKGSDPSAIESSRVYALRNGSWHQLPSLNRPRIAGAAAVVGDRIVVVGGQSQKKLLDTTEVFDGKRWSVVANIPTPREHLAAVTDGRYVYAVGGRALSPDKNSAALERYDPAANAWQKLPSMPAPRGGLGAALAGGRIFAIGGESSTGVFGDVEAYDIARKRWSGQPSLGTPRHGIAAGTIGRSVYALGGGTKPGHASATGTAEVFKPRSG
jgi:non-specific serine/threonine protein kinase